MTLNNAPILGPVLQGHAMLTDRSALVRFDERDDRVAAPVSRVAGPRLALVGTQYAYAPTYGRGGMRQRGPAAIVAFGAMATLFSALVWMNVHTDHHRQQRVVAVDMKLDPPAPPKEQPRPQEEKVELPTTPQITPQPVATQAPPLAPVALSPAPVAPAPPPVVQAPPAPPPPPASPAPKASGPAEGGDLSTKMLSFTAPSYPIESRRAKEEGTVTLSLLLGLDGHVAEISVTGSSGSARLDKAALEAVRKWRWAPVTRNGEGVMVRGTVKIPFIIKH
jgi:protein TonB